MDFAGTVEAAGKAVDLAGVVIMIFGGLVATAAFAMAWRATRDVSVIYRPYRRDLGRAILLGLEFLVAGDIIRTIALSPTFESLGVLAIIVAIRTVMSFAIELDLTGRWPWERKDEPEVAATHPAIRSVGGRR